ncbi:MAG: hypothetical protein HQM14_05675 [SAR324 cluster bacterium]|nr:hypothetical protein [SAR324 cluster bacterium]
MSKKHLQLAQNQQESHAIPETIYPWMVLFHASWLLCCVSEVYFLNRPFLPAMGTLMIFCWLTTCVGRIWMLRTMKESWNVRIVHNPKQTVITKGPYRYIRHPNYVIVAIEIFCIPMIHTAYLTAVTGTCLNALLIWYRLRKEETYLTSLPEYRKKMEHLPRFIPDQFTKLIQQYCSKHIKILKK